MDPSLGILGVLLEPMTVITKALEQVFAGGPARLLGTQDCAGDRRRADWPAGSAPVERERPCRSTSWIAPTSGPKPDLVRALGATYHTGSVLDLDFDPDIIVECTGVGAVIADSIQKVGSGGIICLTGIGAGGAGGTAPSPMSLRQWSLKNNVIVGSVNANKRHWYKAGQNLARSDRHG